jgi:hypothetical protein
MDYNSMLTEVKNGAKARRHGWVGVHVIKCPDGYDTELSIVYNGQEPRHVILETPSIKAKDWEII